MNDFFSYWRVISWEKYIINFLTGTARFISGYSQSVLGVPFLFVPQILKNKFFPCKDFLCIEKNSVRCQILSGSLLNFHKENLKLSKRYFCWRIICCKVWNLVNSTLFAESVRKFFSIWSTLDYNPIHFVWQIFACWLEISLFCLDDVILSLQTSKLVYFCLSSWPFLVLWYTINVNWSCWRFRTILKCFSSLGHYVAPAWQLQLDLIARYMAVLNSRFKLN